MRVLLCTEGRRLTTEASSYDALIAHGIQLKLGVVGQNQGCALQGASNIQLHNRQLRLATLPCVETRTTAADCWCCAGSPLLWHHHQLCNRQLAALLHGQLSVSQQALDC